MHKNKTSRILTVFYNDTYLNHNDTLAFTITLFFAISVIVVCLDAKTDRFESLNFDFCVFNFDTMEFISLAEVSKSLVLSGFCQKEKERKYRINTFFPIRCAIRDSTACFASARKLRPWLPYSRLRTTRYRIIRWKILLDARALSGSSPLNYSKTKKDRSKTCLIRWCAIRDSNP